MVQSKDEEKTPKLLVLRDYVPNGSIRDLLYANKAPMKGYDEKYPAGTKGAGLPDETTGVGLRLVAKQVLLGMQYVTLPFRLVISMLLQVCFHFAADGAALRHIMFALTLGFVPIVIQVS
jgi:hypothetical protein